MTNEHDTINDQITDSIAQINALLMDSEGSNVRAMTYQVMAHTIAMSMYNTVFQQQQMYVLQNATTTAAIKEALKSNPADAVKIAQAAIIDCDLTKTITQLKTLMDELNMTYKDIAAPVVTPKKPPAPKPNTKAKATASTKPPKK